MNQKLLNVSDIKKIYLMFFKRTPLTELRSFKFICLQTEPSVYI